MNLTVAARPQVIRDVGREAECADLVRMIAFINDPFLPVRKLQKHRMGYVLQYERSI